MKQLAPADSVALAAETETLPQNIGVLVVLDPSDAPEFGFEALVRALEGRVERVPVYTHRILEMPFGLDHAYLVADPAFDVRQHLHRSRVPAPGGLRELTELASRLFAPCLDRSRPLWEMWFLDGLADGRVALLYKVHHCLADGVALTGLAQLLFDLSAKPAADRPRDVPQLADRDEGPLSDADLWLRAAENTLQRPLELARVGLSLLRQQVAGATEPRDDAPRTPLQVPATVFNGRVAAGRGYSCARVPFADVRALREHFDVTVNDVLLALASGAVRYYLASRGELPDGELVVSVPVSERSTSHEFTTDNQLTHTTVAFGTHLADPAARLRHIHESAAAGKRRARTRDVNVLSSVGRILAPGAVQWLMRLAAPLGGDLPLPVNLTVSSLRATPFPLYVAGARLEHVYPMTVLQPTQGLGITAVSYVDTVYFGFTHTPELLPDPWVLAEGVEKSLSELLTTRSAARRRRPAD
ncbi:MAG: wax ester/triacylglycerol synthase family O-acyltransferase [Myxococcota bacterium]